MVQNTTRRKRQRRVKTEGCEVATDDNYLSGRCEPETIWGRWLKTARGKAEGELRAAVLEKQRSGIRCLVSAMRLGRQ